MGAEDMTMFRYEPVPRDTGMEEALAARTHDPAWALHRQHGFGEFRGDDAASPVHVSVAQEMHRLDGWHGGDGDWQPYDPSSMVLEELVEQEPPAGPDARLVMEGGLRWQRALAAAGLTALLPAFARVCPFAGGGPLAPSGLAATVRGRLPDPVALAPWLTRLAAHEDAAAAEFGAAESDRAALATAASPWLAWWNTRVPAQELTGPPDPPKAWNENRMEYAFAVRASTLPGVELRAEEYHGGQLDWWSVDASDSHAPLVVDAMVRQDQRKIIPTPAVYGGMPVARFWEMEDSRIDFGAVDATPADLGRLMLVDFATVYGNDWFCIPLPVVVGSLSRVVSCSVTDVFGGETSLAHATAEDTSWSLYGLETGTDPSPGAGGDGTALPSPWYYRPASLPGGLESPPVESVLLLRDEQANLAWAVEETVTDHAGERLDRYDRWIAGMKARAASAAQDGPLPDGASRYRVATEVPAHWYPLIPEALADREQIRLRLVELIRDETSPAEPLGRLLAETGWLFEEEVPRSGIRVERSRQYTRWHDGSAHSWLTRRKGSGTGGGSSGLRFDILEDS
jgi:hypothetical protein